MFSFFLCFTAPLSAISLLFILQLLYTIQMKKKPKVFSPHHSSTNKSIHGKHHHHIVSSANFMNPSSSSSSDRQPHSCHPLQTDNMPSRWYTVLALPFPDQKLGRRDINTFGRDIYSSRAGYFSNPLWVTANAQSMCDNQQTSSTPSSTSSSHYNSFTPAV